ncbi:hypothetical protein IJ21_15250 [Paenibacillus sp. 32O-W]|nr:hypothetical protein IJ21_15250 [Paenibacillus sp. 32O-W]
MEYQGQGLPSQALRGIPELKYQCGQYGTVLCDYANR